MQLFINQLSNQRFINKLSKLEVQPRGSEPGQEWVSKSCVQVQLSHVVSRKLFLLLKPSLVSCLSLSLLSCASDLGHNFSLKSRDDKVAP